MDHHIDVASCLVEADSAVDGDDAVVLPLLALAPCEAGTEVVVLGGAVAQSDAEPDLGSAHVAAGNELTAVGAEQAAGALDGLAPRVAQGPATDDVDGSG